jgi:hypothetical protein
VVGTDESVTISIRATGHRGASSTLRRTTPPLTEDDDPSWELGVCVP